jgi:uncharacterized protein involved in type VI secretion and phage assembly
MTIKDLSFQLSHCEVSQWTLVSVSITDGICQIPSMCIELKLPNDPSLMRLDLIPHLRGLAASVRAEDAHGTRTYAGVVDKVEAELGIQGGVVGLRLHVSGWPRTAKTYTKGYRFFQEKTAVEIASEIFKGQNESNSIKLAEQDIQVRKRTYQVQYGESDQVFVSRLLLREQLLFRVDMNATPPQSERGTTNWHLQAKLNLFSELSDLPLDSTAIDFTPTTTQAEGSKTGFYDVSVHCHNAPDVLSRASYSSDEHNVDLRVTASPVGTTPNNKAENDQWIELEAHALYNDSTQRQSQVERQLKALRANRYSLGCDLLRVTAGTIYSVKGLPGKLDRLAVISSHQEFKRDPVTGSISLTGRFEAVSPDDAFVPPVPPAPALPGLLRGVVVQRTDKGLNPAYAQSGNDNTVHTDEFGRIQVRILWHAEVDAADDSTSADAPWLRLMTPWAGQRAGFFALPRLGQEVMVSFINGDAEQPVVMGAVYGESNGHSTPPWTMPDMAKWVGIGTRSKEGTQQFLRLDATDPSRGNGGVELYAASQLRIDAAKAAIFTAEEITLGHPGSDGNSISVIEELKIVFAGEKSLVDSMVGAAADNNETRQVGDGKTKKITKKFFLNADQYEEKIKENVQKKVDGDFVYAKSQKSFAEIRETKTNFAQTWTDSSIATAGATTSFTGTALTMVGASNGTHGIYSFIYGVGLSIIGVQSANAKFKFDSAIYKTESNKLQQEAAEVKLSSSEVGVQTDSQNVELTNTSIKMSGFCCFS